MIVACRRCWEAHSGVQPTIIGGLPHRPVSYRHVAAVACHFCKTLCTGKVHVYRHVPEEDTRG